jgi:acetyl-CoA acetyltransferase
MEPSGPHTLAGASRLGPAATPSRPRGADRGVLTPRGGQPKKIGLETMCAAGGQGMAMVVQRLS